MTICPKCTSCYDSSCFPSGTQCSDLSRGQANPCSGILVERETYDALSSMVDLMRQMHLSLHSRLSQWPDLRDVFGEEMIEIDQMQEILERSWREFQNGELEENTAIALMEYLRPFGGIQ